MRIYQKNVNSIMGDYNLVDVSENQLKPPIEILTNLFS